MIRRHSAAAAVAAAVVFAVAGCGTAHAQGQGARECPTLTIHVPGSAAGESLAAILRADTRDYLPRSVTERYSARQRIAVVTAVPKHC